MPITWKNIDAPSIGDASRAMAYAGMSINSGLDTLKGTLGEYQAGQEKIWKKEDADATQNLLGQIYKTQGVDGFNALNQSGLLDQTVAANGARIDQAAINAVRDGRMATLQNRDLAGIKYKNTLQEEKEAPTNREIAVETLQNPARALQLLAANPTLQNAPALASALDARQQLVKDRTRNEKRQVWEQSDQTQKELLRPLEVKRIEAEVKKINSAVLTDVAQRNLLGAQARKYSAEAASASEKLGDKGSVGTKLDKAYNTFIKGTPLDGGTFDSEEGKKSLREGLKSFVDSGVLTGKDVSDIYYNLGKYFQKGAPVVDSKGNTAYLPLPVNAILETVGQNAGSWSTINSRVGDNAMSALAKRFGFDTKFTLGSDGEFGTNPELLQGADKDLISVMKRAYGLKTNRDAALLGYNFLNTPASITDTPGSTNAAPGIAKLPTKQEVLRGDSWSNRFLKSIPPSGKEEELLKKKVSSELPSTTTTGAYNGFTLDGKARPKAANSVSVLLDPVGNPVSKTQPVEIPKGIDWGKPTTAVQANAGAIPKGQGSKHVFTYMFDGDTVNSPDGLVCRIDTIDAPEIAKPQYNKKGNFYAEESKKTLEQMILNKEVNVRIVKPADKYGRSVCQIEIEGKGVDEAMVQAGAAMVYDFFAKDTLRYPGLLKAQDDAKKNKRGVWKNGEAENPANSR